MAQKAKRFNEKFMETILKIDEFIYKAGDKIF